MENVVDSYFSVADALGINIKLLPQIKILNFTFNCFQLKELLFQGGS